MTLDAPDPGPLSRETAHELLANRRRRLVLDVLLDRDRIDVRTLADEVARREREGAETQLADGGRDDERPRRIRRRITISLVHVHLPLLAEHGVLAYDLDENVVVPAAEDDLEHVNPFSAPLATVLEGPA